MRFNHSQRQLQSKVFINIVDIVLTLSVFKLLRKLHERDIVIYDVQPLMSKFSVVLLFNKICNFYPFQCFSVRKFYVHGTANKLLSVVIDYESQLNCIHFNPLRPNNDPSQTSHCNIKGASVSEVMRIENMITQVQFY